VTYVAGIGMVQCEAPDRTSLNELVFQATEAALRDAELSRDEIDGVCLGASDQLDGRAISSMQLAGPAGGYLRDEIKVSDDGSLAFAMAVLRLEAGVDDRVLAVSWTKSSESPPDAALGVNPEPVFTRPVGLHPWAGEAVDAGLFLARHDLDRAVFDELAARLRDERPVPAGELCWPLRREHVPPPHDTAVALVVTSEPTAVRVAGLSWAYEHPEPPRRRLTGESAVAAVATGALAEADVALDPAVLVETTDRNPFRLCMTVAGLGLAEPAEAAKSLLVDMGQVNPSGGLWASNPLFAAGLERVLHACRHVRAGADAALAHSSFGYGGQGQLVTVLRRAA
jgi:acetyl-CoA C-acetyltransferase